MPSSAATPGRCVDTMSALRGPSGGTSPSDNLCLRGGLPTFTYYGGVVCQASNSDAPTISQFTYETPYADLNASGLVYASGISCPASGGATSITVTFAGTIPYGAGLRFKYDGYGPGHFIVGAPGSTFATEREASESAYVGPAGLFTGVWLGRVGPAGLSGRPRRVWRVSVGGRALCGRRMAPRDAYGARPAQSESFVWPDREPSCPARCALRRPRRTSRHISRHPRTGRTGNSSRRGGWMRHAAVTSCTSLQ